MVWAVCFSYFLLIFFWCKRKFVLLCRLEVHEKIIWKMSAPSVKTGTFCNCSFFACALRRKNFPVFYLNERISSSCLLSVHSDNSGSSENTKSSSVFRLHSMLKVENHTLYKAPFKNVYIFEILLVLWLKRFEIKASNYEIIQIMQNV